MTDREILIDILDKLKNIPRFDTYYDEEFGDNLHYCPDGLFVNHYEIEDIQKKLEEYLKTS